jgi:hypothetical protein
VAEISRSASMAARSPQGLKSSDLSGDFTQSSFPKGIQEIKMECNLFVCSFDSDLLGEGGLKKEKEKRKNI